MNTKILITVGLAAVLVYLATKDGKITATATRESYYGGGGKCYRLSDDAEVATSKCTERGEDIGVSPFASDRISSGVGAVADAASSAFNSVASSVGSFFGGGK